MGMHPVEQLVAQQGRSGVDERMEIPGPQPGQLAGLDSGREGREQGGRLGDRHPDGNVGVVRYGGHGLGGGREPGAILGGG